MNELRALKPYNLLLTGFLLITIIPQITIIPPFLVESFTACLCTPITPHWKGMRLQHEEVNAEQEYGK
ncbi:MAG: hypothetical protein ACOX79_05490 [Methanosarcina sp.]|jgi:hypothetical protein